LYFSENLFPTYTQKELLQCGQMFLSYWFYDTRN
jgi:hypothetical protein